MNTNKLKQKLKEGKPVFGTFLALNSVEVTQIMANAGYDFLMVDFEHGAMSIETAGAQISAIKATDCTPLIRVPFISMEHTKKGLDSGAYGIMYPMVSNKKDAEEAIAFSAYPPKGVRGAGAVRANMFFTQAAEYFEFEETEILRIVQIENKEAVENIDEILEVEGIDVAFIGPYDLSFSLGVRGDIMHEKVQFAIAEVVEACKRHGVAAGIMTNDKQMVDHLKMGIKFIIYGIEALTLSNAAKGQVEMFEKAKKYVL